MKELVPLRRQKKIHHAHKTGSWYLIGFLFKISVECPGHFHMGVSPPEIPPKRS